MHQLNSARLIGTPAAVADFADLRRLHSDARVMATLSADGATFTDDQTRGAFCNAHPITGKLTASAYGPSARARMATSSATAESNTPPSRAPI